MWAVFEGLDKAGKTTLEWEFLKATNFKHVIVDRGPAGYATFDFIFNRETEKGDKQYARNVATMTVSEDFIVIYCKVPVDVAMQRLKEHNEACPYDYELAQKAYDSFVKEMYENFGIEVLTVDTTKPIDECVRMIVEKFEEVEKK
jgi:deoxyadenosine/deoxycytidine kinase